MPRPLGVVTDIEGTTTPIAFVHRTLFPYARERLPDFVAAHRDAPGVAAALEDVRRLAPGRDPVAVLLGWIDADAKVTPLKSLQGLIWRDGYASGALRSELYPDVAPALRAWSAAGVALAVYSSGSEQAQRDLFGHTPEGDLRPLFGGFFDTTTGAKRDGSSYAAIAGRLGLPADGLLFLSDVEAELDAAAGAGWRVCQLVRPADGTAPTRRHPVAATFAEVARQCDLPVP